MEKLGRGDDYEVRFTYDCIFIGPRHRYMKLIEGIVTCLIKIGPHRPILVMTAIKTYAATPNFKLQKILGIPPFLKIRDRGIPSSEIG